LKRIAILAVCAVFGLTAAAMASGGGHTKIKLRRTTLGKILTTGSGRTVYMFTKDRKNVDKCVKIQFCTSTWPPVTTREAAEAEPGVKQSLLGKIKIAGGKFQVTYAGHPLYTYSGDTGPGQTDYVGISMFGGKWYALNAAGKLVK
jgi:predicted lipoprotein with Yx(FWY)xxD motif